MALLTHEKRKNLLDLRQRAEDAKEALNEATEAVAEQLGVDKGVLGKCVNAWFKDKSPRLRKAAEQTLDLLSDQDISVADTLRRAEEVEAKSEKIFANSNPEADEMLRKHKLAVKEADDFVHRIEVKARKASSKLN